MPGVGPSFSAESVAWTWQSRSAVQLLTP